MEPMVNCEVESSDAMQATHEAALVHYHRASLFLSLENFVESPSDE